MNSSDDIASFMASTDMESSTISSTKDFITIAIYTIGLGAIYYIGSLLWKQDRINSIHRIVRKAIHDAFKKDRQNMYVYRPYSLLNDNNVLLTIILPDMADDLNFSSPYQYIKNDSELLRFHNYISPLFKHRANYSIVPNGIEVSIPIY